LNFKKVTFSRHPERVSHSEGNSDIKGTGERVKSEAVKNRYCDACPGNLYQYLIIQSILNFVIFLFSHNALD